MAYKGFQEKGFKISAAFDRDPAKIGRRVERIQVIDTGAIVPVIRKRKIKIGILAVPAAPARAILDLLVEDGVIAFYSSSFPAVCCEFVIPAEAGIQGPDWIPARSRTLTCQPS